MDAKAEKFLVVINPFEAKHQALQRAVITAGMRQVKPMLHLYINPPTAASADKRSFSNVALQELTSFVEQHALPYDYEFSWSQDIEASVVNSARNEEVNLIIYPLNDEVYNKHKGLAQGTWTLLRNSSCPVMLVTPDSAMQRQVILAAVNFQSKHPEYTALNQRIIKRATWLANKYSAQLHVVNAYQGLEDHPDFDEIRKATGLPFYRIRIMEGKPEKVVSSIAQEVNADLVMIGTRNSHDLQSRFRRNTAEKVLMELNRDMMVVN